MLQNLLPIIQPILVPFCFLSAWIIVIILSWGLFSILRDTIAVSKKMHQVPCANCQFFTGDHRLKCTVQPNFANTERAINCRDYSPLKS